MFVQPLNRARQLVTAGVQALQDRLRSWTTPPRTSLTLGSTHDLTRSTPQRVIENAVLRQHRIVLNRSVKRPRITVQIGCSSSSSGAGCSDCSRE